MSEDEARFLVQRHHAATLHFDFGLEVAGVVVSWSVPKGPSLDPRDRRLAVRTEDRPVDHVDLDGRGAAGKLTVWDSGTYRNLTGHDRPVPMDRAVRNGHLTVWLDGKKLTGAFSFTRTNTRAGRQEKWLLVKKDDEATLQSELDGLRSP